jgi:cytochrome c biogenesis protein CcdA
MLEILLALLAGILTIAAPCILLPLPILLGASVGQTGKSRPIFITLGFVLTFSFLALALNFLVRHLGLSTAALRNFATLLLVIFGLFMSFPQVFERLTLTMSGLLNHAGQTAEKYHQSDFGGFILGVVIGIVWTPCAGPILGAILTLIARQQQLLQASLLLIAYAIGAGLPMLAIAYGGQTLTAKVKTIARYSALLQKVFGLIIILLAIAIYFQYETYIQERLLNIFPSINPKL